MQWATQQDYSLARVHLSSATTSDGKPIDGKPIDVDSIQFVLDNGPPGFFIDGQTGELLGKPTQPLNPTVATLYATHAGMTKAKLWDLSFQFLSDDKANDAYGPNGKGCSGNGTKIDKVEFDSD